ncbi:MAG: hypothetical protein GY795_37515 [Desulfobacterales bacterium]|nr:hypothetical protein [Desulfobacterales bacterium]
MKLLFFKFVTLLSALVLISSIAYANEANIKSIYIKTDYDGMKSLIIDMQGIEPEDIMNFYLDKKNIDDYFLEKKDEGKTYLERTSDGFKIVIEIDDYFSGELFEIVTYTGRLSFDMKNTSAVKKELPSVKKENVISKRTRRRRESNEVTIYGKIKITMPTECYWWFTCCEAENAGGAYVRIYRELPPDVSNYIYTDSYGNYSLTFENYGGERVVVSAKKSGVSDYATVSVGTSGPYAKEVNMTIPLCE